MDMEKIALIKNRLDNEPGETRAGHRGDNGPDSELPHMSGDPERQLSRRELEVLDLLAKGLSNKQIARALYVTPHTVKAHITRILYKLGANSRTEAAVMWATKGSRET